VATRVGVGLAVRAGAPQPPAERIRVAAVGVALHHGDRSAVQRRAAGGGAGPVDGERNPGLVGVELDELGEVAVPVEQQLRVAAAAAGAAVGEHGVGGDKAELEQALADGAPADTVGQRL
jgi:hypothetical protein